MEEKVKIIFEDKYLIVVEKPSGLVTTREGRVGKEDTLEDWLKNEKKIKLKRSGIVHRLDKDTSGLLVVAKTQEVLNGLSGEFKKREVEKRYLAMAGGDLPNRGEIRVPIGRLRYGFGKFGASVEGKKAVSIFEVKAKYKINGKMFSLVEVNLKTGRTHQIRVHMAYMGWPLLGDKLYGGLELSGFGRHFLHACKIKFTHPVGKRLLEFDSPLAPELEEVISRSEKI
ncbi:MAG: RluA family pseudouridine synthase [Patescibacteria group bacterium]|jgi:23S rRNA pseudouridine1911/1915/1917 synthase